MTRLTPNSVPQMPRTYAHGMRLSAGVLLAAVIATLILFVPSALGAEQQRPSTGSFGTEFPQSVAADNFGDVYVLSFQAVEKFDSEGNPVDFADLGSNRIQVSEGVQIAVDNSGGVASGDIYVATQRAIKIFSGSGTELGEITRGSSTGFENLSGLAVDNAGNLYASDINIEEIYKYSPLENPAQNADYKSKIREVLGSPRRIAVDSVGDVYGVLNGGEVVKYNADRFGNGSSNAKEFLPASGPAESVAVQPGTGDIYVLLRSQVEVLDPQGASLGTFGSGLLAEPTAIAVDAAGVVFVANRGSERVVVFGPEPVLPSVKETNPTSVSESAATLTGIVNPNGVSVTSCEFEYGPSRAYGSAAPCNPDPGAGTSQVQVAALIQGLSPATTYHARLRVETPNGVRESADVSFETAGRPPAAETCAVARTTLSANLPDCRAYEQVSPVDKAHYDVSSPPESAYSDVISPSGNAVGISSYVALPGSAAGSLVPALGASRGPSSWNSFRIDVPYSSGITGANNGSGSAFEFGSSADLTKLLVYSPDVLAPGGIEGEGNYYYYDAVAGTYQFVATVPDEIFTYPFLSTIFAGGAANGSSFVFRAFVVLPSTPPVPPSLEALAQFQGILYSWSPTGGIRLVGVLPSGEVDSEGAVPAGTSGENVESVPVQVHAVSEDGSRIYWAEPFGGPIYLRSGARTVLVSHDEAGTPERAMFSYGTPSGDQAFFLSESSLTGKSSPEGSDLYRYDASNGEVVDLTPTSSHSGNAEVTGVFGASDDGSFVYFQANGDLAGGAVAGEPNVYVWHDGEIRLIGTANVFSTPRSFGDPMSEIGVRWRVSPDGRSFGFLTKEHIAGPQPQPATPMSEAYFYSYETGSLVCASCHEGPVNGAARFVAPNSAREGGAMLPYQSQSAFAVTNGGRMFFSTPDDLVPRDTNGKRDVYEYEAGHLALISSGKGQSDSYLIGATPSGDDVFFTSYEQLVGQDVDNNADVYDARVNGGFVSQNPPGAEAACVGEGCRGEGTRPGAALSPASSSFVGAGNEKSPRCKKGKQLRHGKCVKRSHKRPRHQRGRKGRSRKSQSGAHHAKKRSNASHRGGAR